MTRMLARKQRENLAQRQTEAWRPPPLEPGQTAPQRLAATLRRFFDLQAGSIWADVEAPMKSARGKVVDVGCGAQPYRSLLSPEVEYIGLDIADAKQHFGYETAGTIYYDGKEWPAAAKGAHLVLCTEVLEHMLEPGAFLDEAFDALVPGGQLLLTVPFAARWHFIPHDYWRFTPSSLRHLLEGAGFTHVEVWARGNSLTVACYKLMALLLPLLFPQARGIGGWSARLAGASTLPLFVSLALTANLSLRAEGGDDCLGYTVLARRPNQRGAG
ncbi:MAG TPA: class I SAM-dependent methyltransferase [Polyangiaceae bacterium]|nr:class I SAM-dependent methyltransferase [Polyangiaceae bacterium]